MCVCVCVYIYIYIYKYIYIRADIVKHRDRRAHCYTLHDITYV